MRARPGVGVFEPEGEGMGAFMIDSKKCLSSDWAVGTLRAGEVDEEDEEGAEEGAKGLGAFRSRSVRTGRA